MNSLELLKELRTIAAQNGDSITLKTAKGIMEYLITSGALIKNPASYGDFIVEVGHPQIK